jgi:hypothetical protein
VSALARAFEAVLRRFRRPPEADVVPRPLRFLHVPTREELLAPLGPPQQCKSADPCKGKCYVCGPCLASHAWDRRAVIARKHALLVALKERLEHSLSAGVETWPEYEALLEETRLPYTDHIRPPYP